MISSSGIFRKHSSKRAHAVPCTAPKYESMSNRTREGLELDARNLRLPVWRRIVGYRYGPLDEAVVATATRTMFLDAVSVGFARVHVAAFAQPTALSA